MMNEQHMVRRLLPMLAAIAACSSASARNEPPTSAPAPTQAPPPIELLPPASAEVPPPLVVAANSEPPLFVTPTERDVKARGTTRPLASRNLPLLKKKWSTRVGKTTFRTTIAFGEQRVVVGTHGATLNGRNEASDGVYVLAPTTGKLARFIPTPGQGDKDVGGVAIDAADVVFSTDNGQVVKANLATGKTVWSAALAGKVRPAPALGNLDGQGGLDVVVGDEAGDLHAFDGDTGRRLWVKSTGANDYDARGFIAAAALGDLNGDQIDDVVAGARDGVLAAYDGRNGSELWQARDGSGIHASPSLLDLDGDARLEVLAAWSYSRLAIFDAITGTARYGQRLEQDTGGIEGLFGSPVPLPATGSGFIVQGTAWWGGHRASSKNDDTVDGIVFASQAGRELRTNEGRVTATAVVMDLGDDGVWDAVLGTEDRELLSLGADGTRRVLAKLGGPIEASASIIDVDADGSFELLVASNDGLLTCLETGSRTRPLLARFRGNSSDNRGHIESAPLRFKHSAARLSSGHRAEGERQLRSPPSLRSQARDRAYPDR
jgi:outer membrane protein assembly factor BamB